MMSLYEQIIEDHPVFYGHMAAELGWSFHLIINTNPWPLSEDLLYIETFLEIEDEAISFP